METDGLERNADGLTPRWRLSKSELAPDSKRVVLSATNLWSFVTGGDPGLQMRPSWQAAEKAL